MTDWTKKVNRIEKRKPKGGKYWCPICDRFLVHNDQKCMVCGYKEKIKRDRR